MAGYHPFQSSDCANVIAPVHIVTGDSHLFLSLSVHGSLRRFGVRLCTNLGLSWAWKKQLK